MAGLHFSLILLPTLHCNAACDYCFEDKSRATLSLAKLDELIRKFVDHMMRKDIEAMTIHWQGGEVMTQSPQWFAEAFAIITNTAESQGKRITHAMQTNMMGYHPGWNGILAEMFGNSVGSSLDFPNLHRKMAGSFPEEYNREWSEKMETAKGAGIELGVIAIPNEATFREGADRFYSYFVEELGLTDIQINTPFPGGVSNSAKQTLPLNTNQLALFLVELADIWMGKGFGRGITINPFAQLLEYFLNSNSELPCIWGDNCANEFICVDPQGNVAQCDCWVASYPQFRYGNVFTGRSLDELLQNSMVRQRFLSRPGILMEKEDCIECKYLALCHGGCPIRAYSVHGDMMRKDPYCETYKALFHHLEEIACRIARSQCATLGNENQ